MLIGYAPFGTRLSQPLKCSSLMPHEASELAKLQAESYVGVRETLPLELMHATALRRRNRFFNMYQKACAAQQQQPWFNASTAAHLPRRTHSRASNGQDREIAEWFLFLSVVYHDGTFKVAASDL